MSKAIISYLHRPKKEQGVFTRAWVLALDKIISCPNGPLNVIHPLDHPNLGTNCIRTQCDQPNRSREIKKDAG